jgi:RNA polymerase sigma-70 factor (ECF subfamily)
MTTRHPFHAELPEQVPLLHRRALKLTSNRHRAEDLTQETLLKAWASRDSFQPGSNLRAWLFTIMRNTYFSGLRKSRREVEDVDGACALALAEEAPQDHALALEELLCAVAHLPAVQRRALVLMGGLGYSQLEAAEACGCAAGTIKSRVSRARSALGHLTPDDRAFARAGKVRTRQAVPRPQARNTASHAVLMVAGSAVD